VHVGDFDISGWAPQWLPAREQLDVQRDRLLACSGQRIVDSWLVWNLELDKWFADLPVILSLDDGRHLEVCWQKFDELSITWNTIDVSRAPVAWVTWPLVWRSQGHKALRAVTGSIITAVASTEHRFTTRQATTGAEEHAAWLVGGLWLETNDKSLQIFNALDENGLTNDRAAIDEDNRLTPF